MVEFDALYEIWSKEEQDSSFLIALARKLVKVQPENSRAWDALATSIMGFLIPPDRELTLSEKGNLARNPLFWEMTDAFKKEMEIERDDSAIASNRGMVFAHAGLFAEAAVNYLEAYRREKRSPTEYEDRDYLVDILESAAECFEEAGDRERANELANKAKELQKKLETGWEPTQEQ